MNKNATILIGNDYANIDPNYLKSENTKLPTAYNADSIKHTIKILQANNYDINLITWEEYLRNKGLVQKLIIVSTMAFNKDKMGYEYFNKLQKE